jgi:hypothetical protein
LVADIEREERRPRVFETRLLWRIFGPKRELRGIFGPKSDEMTGERRKLDEFHDMMWENGLDWAG